MRKNFMIIIVLLVVGFLVIDNIYLRKKNESLSLTISQVDDSSVIVGNTLGVMLETESGSNTYLGSSLTSWPSSGEYTFSKTNSFCENGSTLTWDSTNNTISFTGSTSDKCSLYFDANPTLANYIISLYTSDGENDLYYFDGEGSYTNAEYEVDDGSYRYSGDDPDNYVCFGDDCTDTDNLYRIIGVFDGEVKLIKYDYATSDLLGTDGDYSGNNGSDAYYYYWNYKQTIAYMNTFDNGIILISNIIAEISADGGSNDWTTSYLNTINLNTNFIKNIGTTWASKIIKHSWIVGGNTSSYISASNVLTAYKYEITYPVEDTLYDAKIGLMYVSDYYYSADTTYWSYTDYSSASNYNWLYIGGREWTITRFSSDSYSSFFIGASGGVGYNSAYTDYVQIRPCFYLNTDVLYVSGTGTIDDPIIIN